MYRKKWKKKNEGSVNNEPRKQQDIPVARFKHGTMHQEQQLGPQVCVKRPPALSRLGYTRFKNVHSKYIYTIHSWCEYKRRDEPRPRTRGGYNGVALLNRSIYNGTKWATALLYCIYEFVYTCIFINMCACAVDLIILLLFVCILRWWWWAREIIRSLQRMAPFFLTLFFFYLFLFWALSSANNQQGQSRAHINTHIFTKVYDTKYIKQTQPQEDCHLFHYTLIKKYNIIYMNKFYCSIDGVYYFFNLQIYIVFII